MKSYAIEFLMLMNSRYQAVLSGLVISALSSISSISLMAVSGWFLTSMAVAGITGELINLFLASALIRFLALSRTLLRYAERLITHDATFKVIEELRLSLFNKSLKLPYLQYVKLQESNTLRLFDESSQQLELGYIRQFLPVCCAVLCGIAAGGFFFAFSKAIGFTVTIFALISGIIVPLALSKFLGSNIKKDHHNRILLNNLASDLVLGLQDLKLTQTLPEKSAQFLKLSRANIDIKCALNFILECGASFVSLCSCLTLISVMFIGATLMSNHLITGPELIMLALSAAVFFEIIMPLSTALLNLGSFGLSAKEVFGFMEQHDAKGGAYEFKDPKLDCIAFDNVSFSYKNQNYSSIRGLSFKLYANDNYLIAGRSGCGKSTLLSLAEGLLAPDKGKILYNGKDLSLFKSRSTMSHFSCCQQQNLLFSGSIINMFASVKPGINQDEIIKTLKIVELDDFILSLPKGLYQWIGDTGTGLSGGQQRRLCLALALILNREFLLLDEPSTGLDIDQADRIIRRILQSRKGVVLISHLKDHAALCPNRIVFDDCGINVNF